MHIVEKLERTWYSTWSDITNTFYVRGNYYKEDGKYSNMFIHRLIMGFPKGKFVDHIDFDTLNNRRSNLRLTTNKQNQQHRRTQDTSSRNSTGYRNVYYSKQSKDFYVHVVDKEGKIISLGRFIDKDEANKVAKEYRDKNYFK